MIYTRLFQRYALPALLTLGLTLLTGCSDQLLTETPSANMTGDEPATSNSKLRHAHLLAGSSNGTSKRVLERYDGLQTDTDFILGLEETVLKPQRVLERYDDLNGVTVNRSFEDAYPGFSVYVKKNALDDFLNVVGGDSDIQWVEPDPTIKYKKPSPSISYENGEYLPWGVDLIDAELFPQAADEYGLSLGDYTQQTHVFVLDSGIESADVNVCETRSFLDDSDGDDLGHGTHIAGTIGAKDNSEGILGIAPNVCLHDYRVMESNGETMLSTVVDAVDHITALKHQHPNASMVVNISLGADVGSTEYNALDEAIQASIEAGVVYVLAAGNDGIDASTVTPARVEDAITVGAHDGASRFARFSNHGPLIDIVAPGVDIISLSNSTNENKELLMKSGTSMAASHVSGAAALYLSLANPQATPTEVRNKLHSMGVNLKGSLPDATTRKGLHLDNLFNQLVANYL